MTTVAPTRTVPATAPVTVADLFPDLALAPSGSDPGWLRSARQVALEWASVRGLPTLKDEDWKYTRLGPLSAAHFERMEPGTGHRFSSAFIDSLTFDAQCTRLVFVNGLFVSALSSLTTLPEGVRVTNLASALDERDAGLEQFFSHPFDEYDHAFSAINTALTEDGALIRVPAGTIVAKPIHLVFLTDAQGSRIVSNPRSLILAGADSRLTIVETYAGTTGDVTCTNAVTQVILDEGAQVEHYKIQDEPDTAFHLALLDVRQGRDSRFSSVSVALGSKIARHEVHVRLQDEGAQVSIDGLYLPSGDQHHDSPVLIEHAAPRCTSHQLYKGIVDERGHGVFNGRIIVWPGAQGTDASQTNKNLLLSEHAEIDTRPRLEIFTDDVKCAHGAGVGALDEEALFYLRSRGLPVEEARSLLTYAFARQMLNRIEPASLRSELETMVARRLSTVDLAVGEVLG
jgi:Fe-S cluster assembly protein SufD